MRTPRGLLYRDVRHPRPAEKTPQKSAGGLLPSSPPGTAGFKSCSLGKAFGAAQRPRSGRGRWHRPGPAREARGWGVDTLLGPQDLTVPGTEPRPAEPDEKEEAGREVGVRGGVPAWVGLGPGKPALRGTRELRDRAGRGVAGSPTSPVIGEWGGAGRRGAGRGPFCRRGLGLVGRAGRPASPPSEAGDWWAGRREAGPRQGRDRARGAEPARRPLR